MPLIYTVKLKWINRTKLTAKYTKPWMNKSYSAGMNTSQELFQVTLHITQHHFINSKLFYLSVLICAGIVAYT